MRTITYRTQWAYAGRSQHQQGSLVDLILDIFYLVSDTGVIPPLAVLNEVLQSGSSGGGMSPGTTWRPFTITEDEYDELVHALLSLDVEEARKSHPYISFARVIVDDELNQHDTHIDWLRHAVEKYPPSNRL